MNMKGFVYAVGVRINKSFKESSYRCVTFINNRLCSSTFADTVWYMSMA